MKKMCNIRPDTKRCKRCETDRELYGIHHFCSDCALFKERYEIIHIGNDMFGRAYATVLSDIGRIETISVNRLFNVREE